MGLNIAMVGVGGLGHLQAKIYREVGGVSVVAAADVSEEARETFETDFRAPAYEHYRKLLQSHGDELDAVAIVTPHTLHYDQAKQAIERGLHVLIEKPMVTDIRHAVDLTEAANQQDVVLQVGYQRHFHPAFREIRRLINSGRIGDLHTVSCYMGQDWIDLQRDRWRTDPSLSGGGHLYDTGSHLLDALLWTTDAIPKSVTAQMNYAAERVDINTAGTVKLNRDGEEVLGSLGLSGDGVEVDPDEGYTYWGSDGMLTYSGQEIVVVETDGLTYRTDVTEGTDFQSLNRRKVENFTESIEGTVEPAVSGMVGVQVTALTEALYRAADTGSVIEVQPLINPTREDSD